MNKKQKRNIYDLKLYLDLDETAEQSVYLKEYFEVEKKVRFKANKSLSLKLPDLFWQKTTKIYYIKQYFN